MKIDLSATYSRRKLRNISVEDFRLAVTSYLQEKLNESEYRLVSQTLELISRHLCEGYKYTRDDHLLIKEGVRTFITHIPLLIRRNIEAYEVANNIKTIWREMSTNNLRGQHYKVLLNE